MHKEFFAAVAADPPTWGKTRIEFFTGPDLRVVYTLCNLFALKAGGIAIRCLFRLAGSLLFRV